MTGKRIGVLGRGVAHTVEGHHVVERLLQHSLRRCIQRVRHTQHDATVVPALLRLLRGGGTRHLCHPKVPLVVGRHHDRVPQSIDRFILVAPHTSEDVHKDIPHASLRKACMHR